MEGSSETCLTERQLMLFGRIVQAYARHEVLMEEIMATVGGADPTSVKLMTRHLPFGWKRATLLNLLRHRGVPVDRIDHVRSLPEPLHSLPHHAREIFVAAFNNAWRTYSDRGDEEQERIAHKVAWSAVKRRYRKSGAGWIDTES